MKNNELNLKFIRLRFGRHPLHLSDGRSLYYSSQKTLHSDTLKNAIYTTAAKLEGFETLNRDGFYDSFVISSAFPFFEEELFLPRPQCDLPFLKDYTHKELKKVKYLGWNIFEDFINGEESLEDTESLTFLNEGACLSNGFEGRGDFDFITYSTQDRVTINQDPFYMELMRFEKGGGVYFFVDWIHPDDEAAPDSEKTEIYKENQLRFKRALYLLADEGIGSDRTYGFGRFSLPEDPDELFEKKALKIPDDPDYQINLGLYRPSNDLQSSFIQNDKKDSYYEILERGGFIAVSPEARFKSWRKLRAYFFGPGSVFPFRSERTGEKIELKPYKNGHSVWREGKTIFIPTKAEYVEPRLS